MGRKSSYKPEFNELATRLCLLGYTDKELAAYFGISEATLNNWKIKHPEFMESLKAGKDEADAKVAESLYLKALKGDTTAALFWLKNRRKHDWRDRHNEPEEVGPSIDYIETVDYEQ